MAATATILRLGAWFPATDTFGPHPASPTGAIIDLNDGIVFSLVDGSSSEGDGLDWGAPTPNVLSSGNVRTTGKAVKTRRYNDNRTVKVALFWGQGTTYAGWISAIHNLVGLCEGITAEKPAALQVQVTGASTPLYLDVLEAHVEVPYNEALWQQLVEYHLTVTLTTKPHFRGPLITLQNLADNPGFEAPSGPGVTVFSDTFSTLNAYTTQSGSAPTQDKAYYSDAVQADMPTTYWRFDETSGTTAIDAANGNAATTGGTVTLGATGLLTGDSDTGYAFNGSSSIVTAATTGWLPTGNQAWTFEAWFKCSSYTGAPFMLFFLGTGAGSSMSRCYVDASGKVNFDLFSVTVTSAVAAAGTAHHVVCVWTGSLASVTVDGITTSSAVTPLTLSYGSFTIGSQTGVGFWFSGTIDEVAFYTGTMLSAARIAAHYLAGHTTPATATNSMLLAGNSSVSFGSPIWAAINAWQIRFRWATNGGISASYHYTDAAHELRAELTATQLIVRQVGAVTPLLATVTLPTSLVPGIHYWLQLTQFPSILGTNTWDMPPQVNATLCYDGGTGIGGGGLAIGTVLATTGAVTTSDASTATSGPPRLTTVTATAIGLGIPGNPRPAHTLSLFGPGGWSVANNSSSTLASGAWEQQALDSSVNANLYTGGPVQSFGAARLDLGPVGTINASWINLDITTPNTVLATGIVPVTGHIYLASAWVRAPSISNTAVLSLGIATYAGSTAITTLSSVTGPQSGWVQLTGTFTAPNGLGQIAAAITVSDLAGASAGRSVWIENVQLWDSTQTGSTTMPYCELWFPQAPAQVTLSGLLGDVSAPATVWLSTYLTALALAGTQFSIAIGRRAHATRGAQLVGAPLTYTSGGKIGVYTLDATAYGGYTITYSNAAGVSALQQTVWSPVSEPSLPVGVVLQGTYHLFNRYQSTQSAPLIKQVFVRPLTFQSAAQSLVGGFAVIASAYGAYQYPLTVPNAWTLVDAGQLQLPPFPIGALATWGGTYLIPTAEWSDPNNANLLGNWQAYLPVDGSVILATVNNPSNSIVFLSGIFSVFNDGVGAQAGYPTPWTIAANSSTLVGPNKSAGGPGTSVSGTLNINATGDSYLTLDPTLLGGVNQICAIYTDQNASIFPARLTIQYTPLYNYPK